MEECKVSSISVKGDMSRRWGGGWRKGGVWVSMRRWEKGNMPKISSDRLPTVLKGKTLLDRIEGEHKSTSKGTSRAWCRSGERG